MSAVLLASQAVIGYCGCIDRGSSLTPIPVTSELPSCVLGNSWGVRPGVGVKGLSAVLSTSQAFIGYCSYIDRGSPLTPIPVTSELTSCVLGDSWGVQSGVGVKGLSAVLSASQAFIGYCGCIDRGSSLTPIPVTSDTLMPQ